MKINNLSKDLQRYGMACSSIEGMEQARVMVEESTGESGNGLVTIQESPTQPKVSALQERRIELLLEMNNKKYDQEIAGLKASLASLASQVDQFKLEMRAVSDRQMQSGIPKKIDTQGVLKTEPKESHPRQGNYTPGDVSMEKIFNFGTGRSKI